MESNIVRFRNVVNFLTIEIVEHFTLVLFILSIVMLFLRSTNYGAYNIHLMETVLMPTAPNGRRDAAHAPYSCYHGNTNPPPTRLSSSPAIVLCKETIFRGDKSFLNSTQLLSCASPLALLDYRTKGSLRRFS